MAEAYTKIDARNLQPGDFILVPPSKGRHRSHGAIDGSAHMRVIGVSSDSRGWTTIQFDGSSATVSSNYQVKVLHK
jgi:hypothetical protein